MTISYSSATLGDAFPLAVSATLSVLVPLQAQLAGLVQLSARLAIKPPSLSANIENVTKMLAKLQVSVSPPSASFQLDAVISLMATIRAQIEAVLEVQAALGVGVHVLTMAGKAGVVGAEFAAQLAGGRLGDPALSQVFGVALMANTPAAEASLRLVFSL